MRQPLRISNNHEQPLSFRAPSVRRRFRFRTDQVFRNAGIRFFFWFSRVVLKIRLPSKPEAARSETSEPTGSIAVAALDRYFASRAIHKNNIN